MIEPIRVIERLKPVALFEPIPGVFVFDFGQNLVGWCRLRVSGPGDTAVTLRHAELVKPDGTLYLDNIRSAKVTDTYILKGAGTESYEPRFTYHGFRYVGLKRELETGQQKDSSRSRGATEGFTRFSTMRRQRNGMISKEQQEKKSFARWQP